MINHHTLLFIFKFLMLNRGCVIMYKDCVLICVLFFCSLLKLSEIMQDKVLQLLPHPQCSGKTKGSHANFCNNSESVSDIISWNTAEAPADLPVGGDMVTELPQFAYEGEKKDKDKLDCCYEVNGTVIVFRVSIIKNTTALGHTNKIRPIKATCIYWHHWHCSIW